MAFGTAPGQAVKDDWDEVEEGSSRMRGGPDLHALIKYFMYHPKVKFGRKFTDREVGALSRSIKKLRLTYTDEAIRRAIDRFYLTRTAQNHPQPAFAFCNLEFQDKLLEGAELIERQDDVMTFIANGFQREEGLDLPWDEDVDSTLRLQFILEADYNVLVRTYPEVVAEILFQWADDPDEGSIMLREALFQLMYLEGSEPKPSARLKDMSARFDLPKDFAKRTNRRRRAKDTITDAVRAARGR